MRNRETIALVFIGFVIGLAGFILLPRLLPRWIPADVVGGAILLCILTMAGCWPAYFVGGIVSLAVWHFSEKWSPLPRLLIRSTSIAMTVAPGLAIGHGVGIAPSVCLISFYLLDGQPRFALIYGLRPLLITWLFVAVLIMFCSILHSERKRS